MKHGSLFSGIGGFDLAASWMGWENVFQVEIDPFCQKVLEKNFPNTKRHGDIKEFDGTQYRGAIDIVSGGFPCQPFSSAGRRKGTSDDRHLWPEMLRVIREVQPRYVVGENVYGLLTWGGGLVFEEVQASLENEGYEVIPVVLPACGVQAIHQRDRVWIIAHSSRDGCRRNSGEFSETDEPETARRQNGRIPKSTYSNEGVLTKDADRFRWNDPINEGGSILGRQWLLGAGNDDDIWGRLPTPPLIRRNDDGISDWLDKRNASLGNAIVPQVAYEIFKAIQATIDGSPQRILSPPWSSSSMDTSAQRAASIHRSNCKDFINPTVLS
jgi:DNA (cytosine-5)-methyltransferase 1